MADTTPRSAGPVDVQALRREADQQLRRRMKPKTWWREMSWRHLVAILSLIHI